MMARQRRYRILELIQEEGSVRVSALREIFNVSEVTIRQDLEKLASGDLVARDHGGAFLKTIPDQVRNLALQHTGNMDKKAYIGEKAAALVNDGDCVILDSGTTTTEIARRMIGKREVTVITTGLNIALILGSQPGIDVMVAGGEFKPPTLSVTGERAAEFFRNVHVDTAFLATAGVSVEAGLTYPGFADLPVKKAIIDAASRVILVADSTKIGKIALARLGGIEMIHTLVTDDGIGEETRAELENNGIEVITG